jgi:hypothetical protein
MNEYKCKGCLIDSTHGKLQKKKEVLLEFIFAENSLCLTVSAQNVNIMAYTLSNESIASVIAATDLLVIIFKAKKQIKISAMGMNKLQELKTILDALVNDDLNGKIKGVFTDHESFLLSLSNPCGGLLSAFIEIEPEQPFHLGQHQPSIGQS